MNKGYRISLFGDRFLETISHQQFKTYESRIFKFFLQQLNVRTNTIYIVANTPMLELLLPFIDVLEMDVYIIFPCLNWSKYSTFKSWISVVKTTKTNVISIYATEDNLDLVDYSKAMEKAVELAIELSEVAVVISSKDTNLMEDSTLRVVAMNAITQEKKCINVLYDL